MTYPAIRIVESESVLIDDESPEAIIAAVDRPRHLRLLPEALVHVKISPDDSDPPVVATADDYPVNEFDEAVVSLAVGERVSIVRTDGDSTPVFVSVSEIKRVLG